MSKKYFTKMLMQIINSNSKKYSIVLSFMQDALTVDFLSDIWLNERLHSLITTLSSNLDSLEVMIKIYFLSQNLHFLNVNKMSIQVLCSEVSQG